MTYDEYVLKLYVKSEYRVGDHVNYRGNFGSGNLELVTIIGYGEKNDRVVYDLDNGHWCYESQIESRMTKPVFI